MGLKNFEAYKLSVEFHHQCKNARCPSYLKNQLLRASSSIALNLAEGSGKNTPLDQRRFYSIALGSIRECQAILELLETNKSKISHQTLDRIAAMTYRLVSPKIV